MARILRHTKMAYEAFVEVNGNLKVNTSSVIGRMKLDDRVMTFLKDYVDFVMNSGVISETTKIYIKSFEHSPMEAIKSYNDTNTGFKQIPAKKAQNHIYYDTKRLQQLFPDDMILNIITKKSDIEVYETMLQNAINKKMGKSLLGKQSVLKIPAIVNVERPSDEEIDNFFMMYAPYTHRVVEVVESELPKNVIGYINYIANKAKPSEEELALINRIKQLDDPIEIE